ncbi:MAG: hypothetical protein ACLT4D_16210 [Blautia faecis]
MDVKVVTDKQADAAEAKNGTLQNRKEGLDYQANAFELIKKFIPSVNSFYYSESDPAFYMMQRRGSCSSLSFPFVPEGMELAGQLAGVSLCEFGR